MDNKKISIRIQNIISDNTQFSLFDVDKICEQFGLYGAVIPFKMDDINSGERGMYVIVSIYPIPEEVNPRNIINDASRDRNVMLTSTNAFRVDPGSLSNTLSSLLYFCLREQFLMMMFAEFNTELPEKINVSEFNLLRMYNEMRYAPNATKETKEVCNLRLQEYFDHLKPTWRRSQEWIDFYHSGRFKPSKYDPYTSTGGKKDFKNRNNRNVSLEHLCEASQVVINLNLSLILWEQTKELMEKEFPYVEYHEGEIEVSESSYCGDDDVTEAEQYLQLKKVFDQKGADFMKDQNIYRYDTINVHIKKSDMKIFKYCFQKSYLEFTKQADRNKLLSRGPIEYINMDMYEIPKLLSEFKKYNIPFDFDILGEFYDSDTVNNVCVLYNACDSNIVQNIAGELIFDNSKYTIVHKEQQINLSDKIKMIDGHLDRNDNPFVNKKKMIGEPKR